MRRILLVVGAVCAVAAPAAASPSRSTAACIVSEEPASGAAQPPSPEIAARTDGRQARLVGRYRGVTISKATTKDRQVFVEVLAGTDAVLVTASPDGPVRVRRGKTTIAVTSAEALAAVQQLLAGSEAVFGARVLLSERENTSDLRPPEMSLLSAAAFLAALTGDVEAPRRLASRYVEKYRGIFRQVRARDDGSCYDAYEAEVTSAWGELQECMDEADQDDSWFRAAYRRLACNAIWLIESEAAWFEFIKCSSPKL